MRATGGTIPRDRWGRPLIIPPDGGEPEAYSRMSGLAKILDDPTNLTKWKQRAVAVGLLKNQPLMTRLAGVVANNPPDSYDFKAKLNKLCQEAVESGGGGNAASTGTGLHELTEALDSGVQIEYVGREDRARLDAYAEATADYGVESSEGFVVVDEIKAAGSYDRLYRCPDGRVRVGDVKTGKWDKDYPMGVTSQLAGYARGSHYDFETGERIPLHPDLDPTVGLLVSLPPSGGCEVIPLDLTLGWEVLKTAVLAKRFRALKAKDFYA